MKKLGKFLALLFFLFTIGNNNANSQDIEDVTHYIVNAGFDVDLTFNSDGTTKHIIDKTTSLSNRSWAYIAEDNSVYAWAKTLDEGNGYWNGADERTHAINGYVGQIYGWTLTHKDFPACEWRYFGTLPYDLGEKAVASAKARNVRYHVGQVLASDAFYAPYGEEWKKWAKYVSEKTGYTIKRCEGDETEEDLARFFGTYVENQSV